MIPSQQFSCIGRLSNSLETSFCLEALEAALAQGRPEIFNSDQGTQFTSTAFTSRLEVEQIAISMDGRGRALDNVFIERLWRSVKYEDVYLKDYELAEELYAGLAAYFAFYNHERSHQSLGYRTPAEVYWTPPRPRGTKLRRKQRQGSSDGVPVVEKP